MALDDSTRITLASGIPRVWDEGVEEHYANIPGESYCARILRCYWEDRAAITNYFLNTWSTVSLGGLSSQVLGIPYPGAPTLLFSKTVDLVKGQPTDQRITDVADPQYGHDGTYQYQGMWAVRYAMLKVGFQAPTINPGSDGTLGVDYSQDVLQANGSGPIWHYDSATGDDVDAQDSPPFRFRAKQIRRTRQNKATIPEAAIDAAILAPVNSQSVSIDGVTYAAEFLRFEGACTTRKTLGTLGLLYDIELTFSYRGRSWLEFFDPATKTWRKIYLADGTTYYQTSDLNLLLV